MKFIPAGKCSTQNKKEIVGLSQKLDSRYQQNITVCFKNFNPLAPRDGKWAPFHSVARGEGNWKHIKTIDPLSLAKLEERSNRDNQEPGTGPNQNIRNKRKKKILQ